MEKESETMHGLFIDCRDPGVDMETTAEWPPAGSLRTCVVFFFSCFFTHCAPVYAHTHKHMNWPGMSQESCSCMYVCQKM